MPMKYDDFLREIRVIKDSGYVSTHRSGDTGVGKTLEDLLKITENNISGPDFELHELKSGRASAPSMLTLFTKVPQPKGANHALLSEFGYRTRVVPKSVGPGETQLILPLNGRSRDAPIPNREKELHVTVEFGRRNSVGLSLAMKGDRLSIANDRGVDAHYDVDYLNQAFTRKYGHHMIYVSAEHRVLVKGQEEFWYKDAYRCSDFSFTKFRALVEQGTIKLDIRLGHHPDGRPHDHGTGFRTLPRNLPKCFSIIEKIL